MEQIIRQIQDNINEFVDGIKQQLEGYVSDLAQQFADQLKVQLFEGIQDQIALAEGQLSRQRADAQKAKQPVQQRQLPLVETSQAALLRAEIGDLRQRLKEVSEVNAQALLQISREIESMQRRGGEGLLQRLEIRVRAVEETVRELQK